MLLRPQVTLESLGPSFTAVDEIVPQFSCVLSNSRFDGVQNMRTEMDLRNHLGCEM